MFPVDTYNASAAPKSCCCLSASLCCSRFHVVPKELFESRLQTCSLFQVSQRISGEGKGALLFICASDQSLLPCPKSHPGSHWKESLKGPSAPSGAQCPGSAEPGCGKHNYVMSFLSYRTVEWFGLKGP